MYKSPFPKSLSRLIILRAVVLSNCILLISFNYGCKKEETGCTDKHTTDSVEFVHTSMLRHQVGDTIHFKKYRVERDSGRKYSYIGEESFVLQSVDTPEVIYREDILNYLCDRVVHSFPIIQNLNGSQPLKCQLVPNGSFDDLQFIFQGKDFRIGSSQYNNHDSWWFEKLYIGGKEYTSVNSTRGYDLHAWPQVGAYKDSTWSYYNDDYGFLRFIINDTLAYERYLK